MLKKRNGRNCVTAKVKNDMWEDINYLTLTLKYWFHGSSWKQKDKTLGLYYQKNFLSIYPASCFLMQKCNGKEVCIGVLEQLNSQSSFHLEKFITLLNMVKTGNVKMIRMHKSRLRYVYFNNTVESIIIVVLSILGCHVLWVITFFSWELLVTSINWNCYNLKANLFVPVCVYVYVH